MRCLFVLHTPNDPQTAVYRTTQERARNLHGRGHQTEIWTPECFGEALGRAGRWLPLAFPAAVARRLRRLSPLPDVLIFHSIAGWAFHLRRPSRRAARVRAVTEFHGLEPLHYRAELAAVSGAGGKVRLRHRLFQTSALPLLLRLSCRRSDGVICLNQTELRYLLERRWTTSDRAVVTANAAPAQFLLPLAYRARASRLLFVGQWLERKGIVPLVRAFASLANQHELELLCVGTLVPEGRVKAAFPPEVRERVRVVERFGRADAYRLFSESDIFVLPTYFEGSSNSLLEAMAAGLPIVTTPVGAAPDLLENEVSALFVAAGDVAGLAAAIGRLIADPALRRGLGVAAQELARRFTEANVYGEYSRFLETVWARSPSNPS